MVKVKVRIKRWSTRKFKRSLGAIETEGRNGMEITKWSMRRTKKFLEEFK